MQMFFIALIATFFFLYSLKTKDQKRRIAFLAARFADYRVEKLMETLTDGYLRALGEKEAERRDSIFSMLKTAEEDMSSQFAKFSSNLSRATEEETRVSVLRLSIPFAAMLIPAATFDLRKAMAIHSKGIARAASEDSSKSERDRAFVMSAELFLMQHTCHWFCRSKSIASARMLVRNKTTYEQLVAAVSPETRRSYLILTRQPSA